MRKNRPLVLWSNIAGSWTRGGGEEGNSLLRPSLAQSRPCTVVTQAGGPLCLRLAHCPAMHPQGGACPCRVSSAQTQSGQSLNAAHEPRHRAATPQTATALNAAYPLLPPGTTAQRQQCGLPTGSGEGGDGAIEEGVGNEGGWGVATSKKCTSPPLCISYALVQATVGVGTVLMLGPNFNSVPNVVQPHKTWVR